MSMDTSLFEDKEAEDEIERGDPESLEPFYETDVDNTVEKGAREASLVKTVLKSVSGISSMAPSEYIEELDEKVEQGTLEGEEIVQLIRYTHQSFVDQRKSWGILKRNYENVEPAELTMFDALNVSLINQYAKDIEEESWEDSTEQLLDEYFASEMPDEILRWTRENLPDKVSYYEAFKGISEAEAILENSHQYWNSLSSEEFKREADRESYWYLEAVSDRISPDLASQNSDPEEIPIMDGGGISARFIDWAEKGTKIAIDQIPYATEGTLEEVSNEVEDVNDTVKGNNREIEDVKDAVEDNAKGIQENQDILQENSCDISEVIGELKRIPRTDDLIGELSEVATQVEYVEERVDDISNRQENIQDGLDDAAEERRKMRDSIQEVDSKIERGFGDLEGKINESLEN